MGCEREGNFVERMLGAGQGGGECYGRAMGEVGPSALGGAASLK